MAAPAKVACHGTRVLWPVQQGAVCEVTPGWVSNGGLSCWRCSLVEDYGQAVVGGLER